jgi:hypothetical protein
MAIATIRLEAKALTLDRATNEVSSAEDPDAERLVYANAFQAWTDGKIERGAEELFEAIQQVLGP